MLLFTHPAMFEHDPGVGHPEHAGRLRAVLDALKHLPLTQRDAPPATSEQLARVHSEGYVRALEPAFEEALSGRVMLDPDTIISGCSREAALRAAGACVAAVEAVCADEDAMAFCAVRPPGHHAEPMAAMGFCLFNNVAVGALHALDGLGLKRVAVVDFDVHHGNGTQTIAEREERLLFVSTHQMPAYPGTGLRAESGLNGNVVNAPLPPGAGSAQWRAAMAERVLPAIDTFEPEMILVSAGFDAHRADPLAQLELETEDYAWAAKALRGLALRHCKGKLVSTLEGGYDLDALAEAAYAYVQALQRD